MEAHMPILAHFTFPHHIRKQYVGLAAFLLFLLLMSLYIEMVPLGLIIEKINKCLLTNKTMTL